MVLTSSISYRQAYWSSAAVLMEVQRVVTFLHFFPFWNVFSNCPHQRRLKVTLMCEEGASRWLQYLSLLIVDSSVGVFVWGFFLALKRSKPPCVELCRGREINAELTVLVSIDCCQQWRREDWQQVPGSRLSQSQQSQEGLKSITCGLKSITRDLKSITRGLRIIT